MLTWPASNFRNPGENTWNYSRCVCVLRTPNQKWRGLFVTSNIFRNRLPCKNLKFWRPNIEITIRHLMCGLIEITCLEWWKSQKQSECSVLQFLLGSLSTRSLRICDTEQERSQGRSCFFFFFWWLCVSARFICLCLIFLSSGWTSVEGSAVMDGAKLRGRSGAPSVSSLGNKTVFMWTQQLTHTHHISRGKVKCSKCFWFDAVMVPDNNSLCCCMVHGLKTIPRHRVGLLFPTKTRGKLIFAAFLLDITIIITFDPY